MRWTLQYENFLIYVLTQKVGENSTVNTFSFCFIRICSDNMFSFVFYKKKLYNVVQCGGK